MQNERITAIVLAGGSGKRMGSTCKKQYIALNGKPVLYYSLKVFQESAVDNIILVANESEYCRNEILEKYDLNKVTKIVPGGAERCDSVYAGLLAAKDCSYVLIHDGARPFVTRAMIQASIDAVKIHRACVIGMPVKDTIRIADGNGFADKTPEREKVWQVQTPQTFSYPMILKAYSKIMEERPANITDDAMAVEYGNYAKVRLIPGSYQNIKITTPEDMAAAEAFLRETARQKKT